MNFVGAGGDRGGAIEHCPNGTGKTAGEDFDHQSRSECSMDRVMRPRLSLIVNNKPRTLISVAVDKRILGVLCEEAEEQIHSER